MLAFGKLENSRKSLQKEIKSLTHFVELDTK